MTTTRSWGSHGQPTYHLEFIRGCTSKKCSWHCLWHHHLLRCKWCHWGWSSPISLGDQTKSPMVIWPIILFSSFCHIWCIAIDLHGCKPLPLWQHLIWLPRLFHFLLLLFLVFNIKVTSIVPMRFVNNRWICRWQWLGGCWWHCWVLCLLHLCCAHGYSRHSSNHDKIKRWLCRMN
jgi:hypothetical protein